MSTVAADIVTVINLPTLFHIKCRSFQLKNYNVHTHTYFRNNYATDTVVQWMVDFISLKYKSGLKVYPKVIHPHKVINYINFN